MIQTRARFTSAAIMGTLRSRTPRKAANRSSKTFVRRPARRSGALSATPPPDVQKVGDDQTFMNEGPVTQFYAVRGDAVIEVEGGFFPAGVTGWVALPAIASKALASR